MFSKMADLTGVIRNGNNGFLGVLFFRRGIYCNLSDAASIKEELDILHTVISSLEG